MICSRFFFLTMVVKFVLFLLAMVYIDLVLKYCHTCETINSRDLESEKRKSELTCLMLKTCLAWARQERKRWFW